MIKEEESLDSYAKLLLLKITWIRDWQDVDLSGSIHKQFGNFA